MIRRSKADIDGFIPSQRALFHWYVCFENLTRFSHLRVLFDPRRAWAFFFSGFRSFVFPTLSRASFLFWPFTLDGLCNCTWFKFLYQNRSNDEKITKTQCTSSFKKDCDKFLRAPYGKLVREVLAIIYFTWFLKRSTFLDLRDRYSNYLTMFEKFSNIE